MLQIPDVDASVDVPDVSGDVSVAAPDVSLPGVSGEASLPSVGGDLSFPQVRAGDRTFDTTSNTMFCSSGTHWAAPYDRFILLRKLPNWLPLTPETCVKRRLLFVRYSRRSTQCFFLPSRLARASISNFGRGTFFFIFFVSCDILSRFVLNRTIGLSRYDS